MLPIQGTQASWLGEKNNRDSSRHPVTFASYFLIYMIRVVSLMWNDKTKKIREIYFSFDFKRLWIIFQVVIHLSGVIFGYFGASFAHDDELKVEVMELVNMSLLLWACVHWYIISSPTVSLHPKQVVRINCDILWTVSLYKEGFFKPLYFRKKHYNSSLFSCVEICHKSENSLLWL